MNRASTVSLFALVFFSTPFARAQEPSAPPAPSVAASALNDVVKLKDGSVFRGTITELVANDHVDLLLAGGNVRRFPMSDVAYAGPFDRAASSPSPPSTPSAEPSNMSGPVVAVVAERVPIHITANVPDLALLVRSGQVNTTGGGTVWTSKGAYPVTYGGTTTSYVNVCTAPCDAVIAKGAYRFALSQHGGAPIESDEPIVVSGPASLEARYESQRAQRIAGWLTVGLGVAIGTTLMLTVDQGQANPYASGRALAGATTIITGLAIGVPLAARSDDAAIRLVPSEGPAPPFPGLRNTVFERISVGPAMLHISGGATFDTLAPMGEYSIGAKVASGLVIGGTVQGTHAEKVVSSDNQFAITATAVLIAPFFDYYFAEDRGAHVTVAPGVVTGAPGATSFGMSVGGGYDFAVFERWKIGPLARLLYRPGMGSSAGSTWLSPTIGIAVTYY